MKVGGIVFTINGIHWNILFVDPLSDYLKRSDGSKTVGMTDGNTNTVYLSNLLRGAFLEKVLCHELCHCFCFSYNIVIDIETEEFMADWISLYGKDLVYLLDSLMSNIVRKTA